MSGLSYCFRDLIQTEVSHRNFPNIINRGKAAAAVVTAAHREEIMESRRDSAGKLIRIAQVKTAKKLKSA